MMAGRQQLVGVLAGLLLAGQPGCKRLLSRPSQEGRSYVVWAKPKVDEASRYVTFVLCVEDDRGQGYNRLTPPEGGGPIAPTIRIYDADGFEVHSARMGYG
jgi:hypothetical protein